MTRDDIIRMAREVGDCLTDKRGREDFIFDCYGIESFANLVVAAEREACAKVLDDWKKHNWTFEDCAAVIRARGK
jgi:hypothetical protein